MRTIYRPKPSWVTPRRPRRWRRSVGWKSDSNWTRSNWLICHGSNCWTARNGKTHCSLSTGQKCTTILPILLLDSDNPLLVDQPEDNLDNRYIYDTIVNAIHRVKKRRQIILITHNPNIPVLGEASAVYVLTSNGERSRLSNHGSVDDCKTEIINLLEGGKEAFVRRKERYSYSSAPGQTGREQRMQEPYSEGIASRTGPESCVVARKGADEALTGVRAGGVLSRESVDQIGVPTPFSRSEGNTGRIATARCGRTPRGQRPHARSEAPRPGPGRSRIRRPRDGMAVRMVNPTGMRP